IHPLLDEEVNFVSAFYVPVKEVRLPYGDREVLYLMGYGEVDNSCCTEGGCGYVQVPGYIIDWKFKTDKNGSARTRVEPITDRDTIKDLRRSIADEEGVLQSVVNFE
ncbi:MAG: hypothetical protein V3S89_01620, partial [Desulfobacterales bacterium]